MPRTYVDANLIQVFDADDPAEQFGVRRGETFCYSENIRPGYTTFGTSPTANLRVPECMLMPGESQYVAGRFLSDENGISVEAGSEGVPENFQLTITPIEVERNTKGEVLCPKRPQVFQSRVLIPGEKMQIYNPLFIEEDIFSDNVYVVQWGKPVNHPPELGLANVFPCIEGKLPRYNLCVERKIIYPEIRLIGLIPSGWESTTVVRADIYISNRLGLKKGEIAGKPMMTGHFEVLAEQTLQEHDPEKTEEIIKAREHDGIIPITFYLGDERETPEDLIRNYIERELIPEHLRQMEKGFKSLPDIEHEIEIKFKE